MLAPKGAESGKNLAVDRSGAVEGGMLAIAIDTEAK